MQFIILSLLILSPLAVALPDALPQYWHEYEGAHQTAGHGDVMGFFNQCYHPDAQCTYCFEGDPEGCKKGRCEDLIQPFASVLNEEGSTFLGSPFSVLSVVHNVVIYRTSNLLETSLGCKGLYSGIACTTFNDDGLIVEHQAYIDNAAGLLKCMAEFAAYKANEGGGQDL